MYCIENMIQMIDLLSNSRSPFFYLQGCPLDHVFIIMQITGNVFNYRKTALLFAVLLEVY